MMPPHQVERLRSMWARRREMLSQPDVGAGASSSNGNVGAVASASAAVPTSSNNVDVSIATPAIAQGFLDIWQTLIAE